MWMAVCFLLLSMRIASTLWMLTSTGLSVYLTLCNVSDPRETQTAHALPPCQMLLGTLPVYVCALRAEAGGSGHSFLCRFAFCIDWIDSNHAFMARRVFCCVSVLQPKRPWCGCHVTFAPQLCVLPPRHQQRGLSCSNHKSTHTHTCMHT